MRVLLVDDNEGFLAMLAEYLTESGDFEIVGTAQTGSAALQMIQSNAPQLLITDLSMPDLTGLELIEQIKAQYPNLPTVILTLFDTSRHRQAAKQAGADGFVSKQQMDTDLLPALQQITNHQHPAV